MEQVEKVPIILKSSRFSQVFSQKKIWILGKNWLNYTQISILLIDFQNVFLNVEIDTIAGARFGSF